MRENRWLGVRGNGIYKGKEEIWKHLSYPMRRVP